MRHLINSFLTLAFFFSACGDSKPAPDASIRQLEVTSLLASSMCNGDVKITDKGNRVLKDAASFSAEFNGSTQGQEVPQVDFTKFFVVAAHTGKENDCGAAVNISAAHETESNIEVEITKTDRMNCPTDGSIAYPFAFALVPISDKPFVLVDKSNKITCP